jgi:hypothetical protein
MAGGGVTVYQLDEHRKAKVADFGLARLLQAPGHFDQTGASLFTYV